MDSLQADCHRAMIAGYCWPQVSVKSSNRAAASVSFTAVIGLRSRASASQSRMEAYRNVLRIRCRMQACTVAYSQVVVIDSGSPLSPSQTTMHTSSTPRFLISVSTESQNSAPSEPRRPTARGCRVRRSR